MELWKPYKQQEKTVPTGSLTDQEGPCRSLRVLTQESRQIVGMFQEVFEESFVGFLHLWGETNRAPLV